MMVLIKIEELRIKLLHKAIKVERVAKMALLVSISQSLLVVLLPLFRVRENFISCAKQK